MRNYNARILKSSQDDYTNALEKVELIYRILKGKAEFLFNQKVIALYGDWGSGKSSIIKTLMSDESEYSINNDYFPILFEAWEFEKDKNLSLSLLEMLMSNSSDNREKLLKRAKSFYSVVKGVTKSLTFNIPLVGTVDSSKIFDELDNFENEHSKRSLYSKKNSLKEEFSSIVNSIKKDGKKLLVFIDDLDRCENENVINLITSIKHLFTLSDDIIFVVTIDKSAITQALKVKYGDQSEKAEEYLEKVFPLNFSLNGDLDYNKYFDELKIESKNFKSINQVHIDMGIRLPLIEFLLKYNVTTPRKFIRIFNKIKLLESFPEINEIKCPECRALLSLTVFNFFVLAEYEKDHYKNFIKSYKKIKIKKNYSSAFSVGPLKGSTPLHQYLELHSNRFSQDQYQVCIEAIDIIQRLI